MHPGLLKLALAHRGVALDPESAPHPEIAHVLARPADPLTATTGRLAGLRYLDLVLPDDLHARVPVNTTPGQGPRYLLRAQGGRTTVIAENEAPPTEYEVRVPPPPRFYERTTSRGQPMHRVATIVGTRVLVDPAAACGVGLRGRPCAACQGRPARADDGWRPEVADVVETVRAAFEEGAAEFVWMTAPLTTEDDAGVAALEPFVAAVKHHFDTLITAHLHPPRSDRWIDRTYAMGIDAVGYAIEAHDAEAFRSHFPGRARIVGRGRYDDALGYAATVFPQGAVWSELIAGLEPPAATRAGIDAVARLGALPVLGVAAWASVPDTAAAVLAPSDLAPLGAHLYAAARAHRLHIGWLRDLSTGVTPLEARYFAGEEARLAVAMQSLARSRIGAMAARSLARFRRRLRVRAVGKSLDASGL